MPPSLLEPGQRWLAPPGALGVEDAGAECQLVAADLADSEGVEQRLRVSVAVDEAQHLYGRPPAQRRPRVRVHVAHDGGHVGRHELVEGEHPLLEYLAHLGLVLLAAALLLRLAGVAVVEAHLEPAALDALPGAGRCRPRRRTRRRCR